MEFLNEFLLSKRDRTPFFGAKCLFWHKKARLREAKDRESEAEQKTYNKESEGFRAMKWLYMNEKQI